MRFTITHNQHLLIHIKLTQIDLAIIKNHYFHTYITYN